MSRTRDLKREGLSIRGIAAALGITKAEVVAGLDPSGGSGLPEGGDVGDVVTNTGLGEGEWARQVRWARWQGAFTVAADPDGGGTLVFVPLLNPDPGNFQSDTAGGWSTDAEGRLIVPECPAVVQLAGSVAFDSGVESEHVIGMQGVTSAGGGNLGAFQILTDSWAHDFNGFVFVGADGEVELTFRQAPWNAVAPVGVVELFAVRLPGSAAWQEVV